MPIYDYNCTECDTTFELHKGWNEDTAAKCPQCGVMVAKSFAVPTVIYKGSGFYTTDYAQGRQKTAASKPTKSNAKDKAGTTKGSDSKVSTKPQASDANQKSK